MTTSNQPLDQPDLTPVLEELLEPYAGTFFPTATRLESALPGSATAAPGLAPATWQVAPAPVTPPNQPVAASYPGVPPWLEKNPAPSAGQPEFSAIGSETDIPAWLAETPATPANPPGLAIPADYQDVPAWLVKDPRSSANLPDFSAIGSETDIPGWLKEITALPANPIGVVVPPSQTEKTLPPDPQTGWEGAISPRVEASGPAAPTADKGWSQVRQDFPILQDKSDGKPLVWLDNGATTQKPTAVIERLDYFYRHENSNIHRGAHNLARIATDAFEAARTSVADFLHAPSSKSIVFTRGTTEGINLVAAACRQRLRPGDEIILSYLEHHANIVPWQILCQETGAKLRIIPVNDQGELLLAEYQRLLGPRTRLVAVTQVSNAIGTITPTGEIVALAKKAGALTLVDGAQSVAHLPTDVQALGVDFFVFSGHKIYGPTGIGALYGRPEVLANLPPYQAGGNMIADVTFERTLYQPPPARFEAGTADISGAVGLGEALNYVNKLGITNISAYETSLIGPVSEILQQVNGLRLLGPTHNKAAIFSFVIDGVDNARVGEALKAEGIALRIGHHCAQPILRRLGVEQSIRATAALYNTVEEFEFLASVLKRLR
ncbi:MAG: SufS family cysteine desulfurase [Planctomycetota bacterium]|jgi:cysteine desulfurase/selenocysteine lyase|nr:SufS family cysteine desulfurase [Planctomycetota bacterium]